MPAVKAKIKVRDLGTETKTAIDRKGLKKVRGGMTMAATAAKKPKPRPEGCDHAGQHCDMLHVSPMAKPSTVLTVVVDGRPR